MNRWWRPEQLDSLRAIPLAKVLPLCGAQPDSHDPHRWHTPEGVLSVTDAQFMNWNRAVGGGGAIDLVIHLKHMDFKAAVGWLVRYFPDVRSSQPVTPRPPPHGQLPLPDSAKLGRVQHYLSRQRGIAPALTEPLIQAGTLYADAKANAVFILLGKNNLPVGAELRGTTERPWHGLAPGSRKDRGFFATPLSPTVLDDWPLILCESAIDALSCLAIYPRHRCLSTAGARPNPKWLAAIIAQASQVYCGFDADPTGDAMAHAMIALHPTVKRLRPSLHDWNDMLRAGL